ncbi:MAG TPA: CCA tRNA nucleotidyltransferase [Verrucomicrobiae bacterium]|nr:CCA tRNA nucleotidyltransferase [Verrucomicrobiae bacterium]
MTDHTTLQPKASQPEFFNGKLVLQSLESIFDEIYLVGGAVRDMLLGRDSPDLDFATPALPGDIQKTLENEGLKTYLAGKNYGTIGTKIGPFYVEITSFRAEKYHEESRNPDVKFGVSLKTDLARRDFTMNAMAYSHTRLVDPFDGQADIQNRLIRAVGDAEEKFYDDPLRILRLFRFASQLGFEPEQYTLEAARHTVPAIKKVSNERIRSEFEILLQGTFWINAVEDLVSSGVLQATFPEQYSFAALETEQLQEQLARYAFEELREMSIMDKWALLIRASFEAVQAEWGDDPDLLTFDGVSDRLGWSKKTIAALGERVAVAEF